MIKFDAATSVWKWWRIWKEDEKDNFFNSLLSKFYFYFPLLLGSKRKNTNDINLLTFSQNLIKKVKVTTRPLKRAASQSNSCNQSNWNGNERMQRKFGIIELNWFEQFRVSITQIALHLKKICLFVLLRKWWVKRQSQQKICTNKWIILIFNPNLNILTRLC